MMSLDAEPFLAKSAREIVSAVDASRAHFQKELPPGDAEMLLFPAMDTFWLNRTLLGCDDECRE